MRLQCIRTLNATPPQQPHPGFLPPSIGVVTLSSKLSELSALCTGTECHSLIGPRPYSSTLLFVAFMAFKRAYLPCRAVCYACLGTPRELSPGTDPSQAFCLGFFALVQWL